MNRRQIFTVLILLAVIVPLLAIAQPLALQKEGLVPCEGISCTECDIFELIGNIIWFILFALITPATVVAFLIGGVLLVTAGGSEEKVKQAKSILWNTVLGFIIAFGAWLIINTLLNTIIKGGFDPLGRPECQIETTTGELKGPARGFIF